MSLQKEETSFTSLALWVMCYCATDARQTSRGNLNTRLKVRLFFFPRKSLNKYTPTNRRQLQVEIKKTTMISSPRGPRCNIIVIISSARSSGPGPTNADIIHIPLMRNTDSDLILKCDHGQMK
ncbi:uncharacterized [Lates japonicus]